MIKKSSNMFSAKGFTLVELLVVIGILGILAAGLLAVIDPLEQFRKGQDTNTKQTALELVNSLQRYYATHQAWPWSVAATTPACNGGTIPTAFKVSDGSILITPFDACITYLVGEGELKSTFPKQTAILKNLFVTDISSGNNAQIAVCFNPSSKAEQKRSETLYTVAAVTQASGTCPNTGTTCYWCAQ